MEMAKRDLNFRYSRHLRGPSLQFLKTFLIVAARGSCKAAAESLCVTSAAVSQQIKQLELQLGISLFDRKANSLTLTDAGAHYFESIHSLFSRIDLATEQVRRRCRRTLVRLQVPSLFFTELLVPQLPEFTAEYPDIDLQISTSAVARADYPSDVDVSIAVAGSSPKEVHATILFSQAFVPAAQPRLLLQRNITAPSDITNQVLLSHRSRHDLWDVWADASGIREFRPKQMIQLDSLSAVVHAAEGGVGIALVSAPLASARFAAGTLRRIGAAELRTGENYLLITRRDETMRPGMDQVVDWLLHRFHRASCVEANGKLA